MTRVVILKLVTGEELLAKVSDEQGEDEVVFFDHPRKIQLVTGDDGKPAGTFSPWIISHPMAEHIPIAYSTIVTSIDAPQQLADFYLKEFNRIQLLS